MARKRQYKPVSTVGAIDTILDIRKDTEALKQLSDLEELISVPPERGGLYFSGWEKHFVQSVREQHNRTLNFSDAQREKIKDIWHLADVRKRERPVEKVANLFSGMSPEKQAQQRAKAKGILPWEK